MWNRLQAGDEAARSELLNSLSPLIKNYLRRFKGWPINEAVLQARAQTLANNALAKYDPEKAQLSTYIQHQLQPLIRYAKAHQIPSYLPENLSSLLGQVDKASHNFYTKHGREPTIVELADITDIDADIVERVQMGLKPVSLISTIADEANTEANIHESLRRRQMDNVRYLRAELEGTERKAFDRFVKAMDTGEQIKPQEVADQLKIDINDIYGWRRNWNTRLKDVRT
jgi:DNA-directed RNA polymerase specialized sigma subunit